MVARPDTKSISMLTLMIWRGLERLDKERK
jgi:hypothetical protein